MLSKCLLFNSSELCCLCINIFQTKLTLIICLEKYLMNG